MKKVICVAIIAVCGTCHPLCAQTILGKWKLQEVVRPHYIQPEYDSEAEEEVADSVVTADTYESYDFDNSSVDSVVVEDEYVADEDYEEIEGMYSWGSGVCRSGTLYIKDNKTLDVYGVDDRFLSKEEYAIYNDSILVVGVDVYVIRKLTKNELVLVGDAKKFGQAEQLFRYVRPQYWQGPTAETNYPYEIPAWPVIRRLPASEISRCQTPAAVAYNFVSAIYNGDDVRLMSFLTPDFKEQFERLRYQGNYPTYYSFFTGILDESLNVLGWKPWIDSGNYEITVLQSAEWGYNLQGREEHIVSIDCVHKSWILGNLTVKDYADRNAQLKPLSIYLTKMDNGFKIRKIK